MDKQLIGQALASLVPATRESQILTDPSFDWDWNLVGNETAEELDALAKMLREAKRFCSELANGFQPRWLCFLGTTGNGKTFLSKQICAYVRKVGESTYNARRVGLDNPETCWSYAQEGPTFAKWLKVLDAARNGDYGPSTRAGRDWFKCLDDVGAEGVNEKREAYAFASNLLGKIADERVGKWTVLTSNFSRRQIAERFDPRVASRMTRDGGTIVDASGVRDYQIRLEEWHRKRVA